MCALTRLFKAPPLLGVCPLLNGVMAMEMKSYAVEMLGTGSVEWELNEIGTGSGRMMCSTEGLDLKDSAMQYRD